jgi:hypothetical protein
MGGGVVFPRGELTRLGGGGGGAVPSAIELFQSRWRRREGLRRFFPRRQTQLLGRRGWIDRDDPARGHGWPRPLFFEAVGCRGSLCDGSEVGAEDLFAAGAGSGVAWGSRVDPTSGGAGSLGRTTSSSGIRSIIRPRARRAGSPGNIGVTFDWVALGGSGPGGGGAERLSGSPSSTAISSSSGATSATTPGPSSTVGSPPSPCRSSLIRRLAVERGLGGLSDTPQRGAKGHEC